MNALDRRPLSIDLLIGKRPPEPETTKKVDLVADQRDPWNTDYSADCSVEDEDVEHLTVSLALESERT